MVAIQVKDLTKIYTTGHLWWATKIIALDHLNLHVFSHQVFGLLGLNGAGKTTLMKILLGLIPSTFGTAMVLGKPVNDIPTKHFIGYLPEMPYFPRYLTPYEILDFYGQLFNISLPERKQRIESSLEIVGLFGRKNSKLKEFSKGMLQRVGMAQLLINDPMILFLDEPTFGLDPLAAKEMRDIILGLKKRGKTIFLNSHQINEVERICDRIGILHEGKLIHAAIVKPHLEKFFVKVIRNAQQNRNR